ncbi:hypothetical protein GT347_16010 [Xylophilus rhododendri]|uniref:Uncharacterized protein n=1 Tax=Xylophilus rhododendri TaxID=2697032 RepID=A0A857J8I1_9BURK|nr:hypothetical protein [Xylophilus rhododendri]QHI99349.1 hypothetical protein GT347_16010 [Xylophilus rhododendri]
MARIEWMHNRLQNWALWAARERGGGLGFSTQSVLLRDVTGSEARESWVPVDEVEAGITDRAVSSLAEPHPELHETLVHFYIHQLSAIGIVAAGSAASVSTVHSRLANADRKLAAWLAARTERQTAAAAPLPKAPRVTGTLRRSKNGSFTT